jgi:hypothetical protein
MNKVTEDILYQASCGRMLGCKRSLGMVPESLKDVVLRELDERHVKYDFESIDNNIVYHEPQFVYKVTLPDDFQLED